MTRARVRDRLLCLALISLASCGDDPVEGNGTDRGEPANGEPVATWDGPVITQEAIDRFLAARPAFDAEKDLAEYGFTKYEWTELDRALKACLQVIDAAGSEQYIAQLDASIRKLEGELAKGSGLDAATRERLEDELAGARADLEAEQAYLAELPKGIPEEYLDVVRENQDRILRPRKE